MSYSLICIKEGLTLSDSTLNYSFSFSYKFYVLLIALSPCSFLLLTFFLILR